MPNPDFGLKAATDHSPHNYHCRNHSERLRNDAIRLMRQTDEKTTQGQRDAGRRIGERLTDLSFWRNELHTELEKLLSEYALLSDTRRKANKALQVIGLGFL